MKSLSEQVFAVFLVFSMICQGLWAPRARADQTQQANALLSYFGAGCSTQGEWTQAALSDARALVSTVRALQSDPDCRSMSESISELDGLTQRLTALSTDTVRKQYLSDRRAEEELLLQVSIETNPTFRATLLDRLRAVQVNLARNQGFQGSDDAVARDLETGETLRALATGVNTLMGSAIANTSCIEKNASLFTGLASLAGSVGAVAMTGGASLGVAAGVELLGTLTKRARENRLARRINELAEPITRAAFQCALESLSNRWCSAEDAQRIVQLRADWLSSRGPDFTIDSDPSPLLRGTRILDRDFPLFLSWLEKIRSGSEPTSQAAADRQSRVLDRERSVRQAKPQALGIYSENLVLFDNAGTGTDIETQKRRWSIEKDMISEIIKKVSGFTPGQLAQAASYGSGGGDSAPTPFLTAITPLPYVPYFLLGISAAAAPKDPSSGAFKNFDQFDPFGADAPAGGFVPNPAIVKTRMLEWIQLAQDRVNLELSLILQPDPLQLIFDATTEDRDGRAPYLSLVRIIRFLEDQRPPNFVVGSHERLYRETLERLRTIRTMIAQVAEIEGTPMPDRPTTELGEIYVAAALDSGTVLLGGRLERSIRYALNEILLNGDAALDLSTSSQLLAANDILAELQRFSSQPNLTAIRSDLIEAKVITAETLSAFGSTFAIGLRNSLRKLQEQGANLVSTQGRDAREVQAKLCMTLLAVPAWPREIPHRLCDGMVLRSVFRGGPSTPVITESSFNLPPESRACLYRNFLRADRIYQNALDRSDTGFPR